MRHDSSVAAPRVFDHRPAIALALGGRFRSSVCRSNRLGGVAEGGIVRIDHHVGQEAGYPVVHALRAKLVEERISKDVPDAALRIGDRHVEAEARDR